MKDMSNNQKQLGVLTSLQLDRGRYVLLW